MSLPTYHIYCDTPEGRLPFTLFVFGPYATLDGNEWDVELFREHLTADTRDHDLYVDTVSSLKRDTHIVGDIIETLNAMVNA